MDFNNLVSLGANVGMSVIGTSAIFIAVDRWGMGLIAKYFPKLIFPVILRYIQKFDDIIDGNKKNPKFQKSITEFEKQLIALLEKTISLLKAK